MHGNVRPRGKESDSKIEVAKGTQLLRAQKVHNIEATGRTAQRWPHCVLKRRASVD